MNSSSKRSSDLVDPEESLRVVLTTQGRFHSFDLAGQLQKASLLTRIYTTYPKFKLRNTSVDPRLIRSFSPVWLAYRLLERQAARPFAKQMLQLAAAKSIDLYARYTFPECDVVMGLSGGGLATGRIVQRRGGSYVCDRGSTHIRYQMQILTEEYDRVGLPFAPDHRRLIEREEAEYAQADAITVPSRAALRSFIQMGVDPAKLHQIPYGVDLSHFSRTAPRDSNFRILFVGQLTVRKGIVYLLEAFRRAALPGAKLIFVGPHSAETAALLRGKDLDDVEFTGPVSRERVGLEMSRASVMALPSIEEGLAMVQGQALACGCPIIATTNTGGEDLFEDGKEGFIVPIRDPEAIAAVLTRLYRDRDLLDEMSIAARRRVEHIGGWDEYGRRMIALFTDLRNGKARVSKGD